MLRAMQLGDEHSFRVDDPVARYWLHNSVGFGVRGLRGGGGVVDKVGEGPDGAAVLTVRRRGLPGMTTLVPVSRVESVDPWDETIVLRSHRREPRQLHAEQANRAAHVAAEQANRAGHVVARAARAAAIVAAIATRKFLSAVAMLLLKLAAFVRKHAPEARSRMNRIATTLGLIGRAYAVEAARAYRAQRQAVDAWREERKRGEWGDDSPLTRAGADEVDARSEESLRR